VELFYSGLLCIVGYFFSETGGSKETINEDVG